MSAAIALIIFQVVNQVVIWDRIIEGKDESHLKLVEEKVEYVLSDQGEGLR